VSAGKGDKWVKYNKRSYDKGYERIFTDDPQGTEGVHNNERVQPKNTRRVSGSVEGDGQAVVQREEPNATLHETNTHRRGQTQPIGT
jgi:hypothetical protein